MLQHIGYIPVWFWELIFLFQYIFKYFKNDLFILEKGEGRGRVSFVFFF